MSIRSLRTRIKVWEGDWIADTTPPSKDKPWRWAVLQFVSDRMQDPLVSLCCWFIGHQPEMDHCGIPEHDYCIYCQESTPGQAPRRMRGRTP